MGLFDGFRKNDSNNSVDKGRDKHKGAEGEKTSAHLDSTEIFDDFNFKLIVIEALLDKSPSFEKELEAIKNEYVTPFEYYVDDEAIEEVLSFFNKIQLPQDDLDKITEICFDGGNEIYHLIKPDWDGEDNRFDVYSVKGFEYLRNLKSVFYASMCEENVLNPLKEKGIIVK